MGENSAIEWTDHTVNFWIGCTKISAACDHCYAEAQAARFGLAKWGHGETRVKTKSAIATAFRLDRKAAKLGRRFKVFSNSMSDFFDAEVPDAWRDEAFAVMALTPNLDWLVLTKRPKVMREYLCGEPPLQRLHRAAAGDTTGETAAKFRPYGNVYSLYLDVPWPLPNVWLGVTVENQKMADLRIPDLLATPAARRFLSCEPLLGEIDLTDVPWPSGHLLYPESDDISEARSALHTIGGARIDWVIAGGESGPQARPMHPDWARSLRDQCRAAGVPFFFKQHGEWIGVPDLRRLPDGGGPGFGAYDHYAYDMGHEAVRVGKARAGRLLDGRTWDEVAG